MKKWMSFLLAGALLFTLTACGAAPDASDVLPDDSSTPPDNTLHSPTDEELYTAFLTGEIGAIDKENDRMYVQDYLWEGYNNQCARYDMNGDSRPELLLRTRNGMDILWVAEQTLRIWYSGAIYEKPLNNGAIFYERPGGAPKHTSYRYTILTYTGETMHSIDFSEYDDNGNKLYFINNQEVSADAYTGLHNTILPHVRDDAIEWQKMTDLPPTAATGSSDVFTTLHKSGKNFTIYTDGLNYRYTITAADGSVLDQGEHDYRGAFDITPLGELLVLENGSGGNARSSYKYYDPQKGLVSSLFHNVLAVDGTRVVYFAERKTDGVTILVVRDMFDPAHGYTEIVRDFAAGTALYYNTEATFSDNGTKLEIAYPYTSATPDMPEQYKTETILLN